MAASHSCVVGEFGAISPTYDRPPNNIQVCGMQGPPWPHGALTTGHCEHSLRSIDSSSQCTKCSSAWTAGRDWPGPSFGLAHEAAWRARRRLRYYNPHPPSCLGYFLVSAPISLVSRDPGGPTLPA